MQDIVRRPRLAPPTPDVPENTMPVARVFERCINKVGTILTGTANWTKQVLDRSSEPRTITESVVSTPFSLTQEKGEPSQPLKKISSHSKSVARSVASSAKKAGNKTRQHLKTPVGKLALVQAVAMIALFSYVATKDHSVVLDTKNIGQTTEAGPLRQYLPNSQNAASAFQPFQEKFATVATTANSGLKLDTFLTPWNISDLEGHTDLYSAFQVFWLTVNPDGVSFDTKASWDIWQTFYNAHAKENKPFYLVVSGDPSATFLAISNPILRDEHIANLLTLVQQHNFDGVNINYEGLGSQNSQAFTDFIQALTTKFTAAHKSVIVTLEAGVTQPPMDVATISHLVKEVDMMFYDYHTQNTTETGPIAPEGWIKEHLDYLHNTAKAGSIVPILGNYGYDWVAGDQPNTYTGTGISYDRAMAIAQQYKAPVINQTGTDSRGFYTISAPTFTYTDTDSKQHTVYFEDAQSLQNKVSLIEQYPEINTVSFWQAGFGPQDFWQNQSTP